MHETDARRDSYLESRTSDVRAWSDASLVEAVRGETVDERALDVLVARHWKALFGRCRMLTLNSDEAMDLAQSAWIRVLRARRSLDPTQSFGAYLSVIATNLWRDQVRTARRAGALAAHRVTSLDAPTMRDDGTTMLLGDVLPDPGSLSGEEQLMLAADIDVALARLTPRQRDVLIARFLQGDSAAEIAKREGRSEQAISGRVRDALAEMRHHLWHWRHDTARQEDE